MRTEFNERRITMKNVIIMSSEIEMEKSWLKKRDGGEMRTRNGQTRERTRRRKEEESARERASVRSVIRKVVVLCEKSPLDFRGK